MPSKRHQDILTARLEDAFLNGTSHITWNELYYWYDAQRITVGIYRDLEERWQAITGGDKGMLNKVEGRNGIYIFGSDSVTLVYPDADE